jgi:hypothetical protein
MAAQDAARPPQDNVDIQAMRELANSAARLAIMEFEWKQDTRIASDKVLVMLVGLPCGLLMLYLSLGRTFAGSLIGAVMAFFVVAVWGVQTLRVLLKMARNRLARNHIQRKVSGLP